jgi:16S rRNA (guanine527-N7)-methyltransferase
VTTLNRLPAGVQDVLGLRLSEAQTRAFELYAEELVVWNRSMNLTAITEPEDIESKHFLDSLSCLLAEGFRPPGRLIDVGTGAGFPGLPLKILFPAFQLTLVESVGKKVEFCRHIIQKLDLSGVEVVHDRIERVGKDATHRERYDWALARAVAVVPVLLEYLLPLLKIGGQAVLQKGETGLQEVQSASKAFQMLGGQVRQLLPLELPHVPETRYLVVIQKIAATHGRYPRRTGIPSKRPIQ